MNAMMVLRVALKALRVNKLRSSLTMLGMIIGVAAVIAMLAIGGGAQERVRDQLKNLGSNLMLIIPGSTTASGVRLGTGAAQTLTEEDAQAIALEVEGVVVAAPSLRGSIARHRRRHEDASMSAARPLRRRLRPPRGGRPQGEGAT